MGEESFAAEPQDADSLGAVDYENPGARIAVVGPSGSGKTLLSLALGLPQTPASDGLGLRIRARMLEDSDLLSSDIRAVVTTLQPSRDAVARRELDVDLPGPSPTPLADVRRWIDSVFGPSLGLSLLGPEMTRDENLTVRVELVDGPGGVLFPRPDERDRIFNCGPKLLALVESAQALILCVNAINPETATLRSGLPRLFAQMARDDGYLPYRAVLLLVTHVDQITARFLGSIRRQTTVGRFLWTAPRAACARLCRQMHATELARSLVGDDVLHQLWSHVAPGSKLGIGVVAAAGCDFALDASNRAASRVTIPAEAAWGPFGLEEALYFVLSGVPPRRRRVGTVMEYPKDARSQLPHTPFSEIPLEHFA